MGLPDRSSDTDLAFWFDPVCPFAWMTSKWIRSVQRQRGLDVEWRLISLRLLNADIDYDAHFPPEYEAGHNAGLYWLRVAAAVREANGWESLDRVQQVFGNHVFEVPRGGEQARQANHGHALAVTVLDEAGLDTDLADAVHDASFDVVIRADTDSALALAGKDVGTPIMQFDPPDGPAFFGPVISRLPSDDDAVQLWDHVTGLARFGGFTELKRSLRERPQLRALGVEDGAIGKVEDWHGGSRRQKHERG